MRIELATLQVDLKQDRLDDVRRLLIDCLRSADVDVDGAETILHRWRYASVVAPADSPHLVDSELKLAACGDWCSAPRVESAFLSGFTLAESLQNRE